MTIHPLLPQDAGEQGLTTAYDSVWAHTEIPTQEATGLDGVMLSHDKLYVVLAVVLLIWFGLLLFLYRTDRRLDRLERTLETRIPEESDAPLT